MTECITVIYLTDFLHAVSEQMERFPLLLLQIQIFQLAKHGVFFLVKHEQETQRICQSFILLKNAFTKSEYEVAELLSDNERLFGRQICWFLQKLLDECMLPPGICSLKPPR